MYFVDSGRPLTGALTLVKTRSHLGQDDAHKLWKRLQADDWRQRPPAGRGPRTPMPQRAAIDLLAVAMAVSTCN
jgi:hypothetical protein